MMNWPWYVQVLIALGYVVAVIVLFFIWLGTRGRKALVTGLALLLVLVGAPALLVAWSWLDDDAPAQQCERAGGVVVVTPAQGRLCIDADVVIEP
jgi:hypothetical protein